MEEGNTLANALIGGIASVLLSFVPLSPVLGGAIAGYLEGGSRNEGLWVGIYAGVVAAVPVAVGGIVFLFWGALLAGFGDAFALSLVALLAVVLVGIVAAALYTVGLSAVGGWLGNYVKYDTDLLA